MRKLIFLLGVILCTLTDCHAQDISGKWRYTKDFLVGMGLRYNRMHGYCKFKRNGTFKVKINGRRQLRKRQVIPRQNRPPIRIRSVQRTMYIKARGKYIVEDGRITTIVKPKSVRCYVEPGREPPGIPDAQTSEFVLRAMERAQRYYESAVFDAEIQANMIKEEHTYVWAWNNEPLTLTKDSLLIGSRVKFKR